MKVVSLDTRQVDRRYLGDEGDVYTGVRYLGDEGDVYAGVRLDELDQHLRSDVPQQIYNKRPTKKLQSPFHEQVFKRVPVGHNNK